MQDVKLVVWALHGPGPGRALRPSRDFAYRACLVMRHYASDGGHPHDDGQADEKKACLRVPLAWSVLHRPWLESKEKRTFVSGRTKCGIDWPWTARTIRCGLGSGLPGHPHGPVLGGRAVLDLPACTLLHRCLGNIYCYHPRWVVPERTQRAHLLSRRRQLLVTPTLRRSSAQDLSPQ